MENVLAVHKKYLDMIKEVFQGDQAFIGALDKACNAVINHRQPKQPSKAPELVSKIVSNISFSFDDKFKIFRLSILIVQMQ